MSAAGAPVVRVEGLRKSYGERAALRGVSLEARAGELVACIGPNGAGKTTLLAIVAGLTAPDGGTVDVAAECVGWVPQRPGLYAKLSARENLRLFARLKKATDPDAAVARMLALARLETRADEPIERLSAGNRQRVNVAAGLVADPALLLLDEPSAALDAPQRERLWEVVTGLAERGTAVLYATHDIAEAERHSDRVLVLADGERLFWGSTSDLWAAVAPDAPRAADAPRAGEYPGASLLRSDPESGFVAFLRRHGH